MQRFEAAVAIEKADGTREIGVYDYDNGEWVQIGFDTFSEAEQRAIELNLEETEEEDGKV